jgi:hypothetical protein
VRRRRLVGLVLFAALALAACRKTEAPDAATATPTPAAEAAATVVFIHGIGNQSAGYSDSMRDLLALRMGSGVAFREVLWSDLGTILGLRTAPNAELQRAEEAWKAEIDRAQAEIATMRSPDLDRARLQLEYTAARGYVGPILRYEFLSPAERGKIQARLREALDAAGRGRIYLVAHSLGSVIAFDVLHGWEGGAAPPKVDSFYTLGSPLNSGIFRGHNGRPTSAPSGVTSWTNVYSPWDPIASALAAAYSGVSDRKVETQIFPTTAHSAYWTHTDVIALFPEGLAVP